MTMLLDAATRRDLCALLARLFAAEIDVALYRQLLAHDQFGCLEATLREQSPEAAVEALAVELCRLFIGPQPACAPYASTQQGEALLGGRSRTRCVAVGSGVLCAAQPGCFVKSVPYRSRADHRRAGRSGTGYSAHHGGGLLRTGCLQGVRSAEGRDRGRPA